MWPWASLRVLRRTPSGPLTGLRHPPVRLYNVHLIIMSAFARTASLGFFVLALRAPTDLTPLDLLLYSYSLGTCDTSVSLQIFGRSLIALHRRLSRRFRLGSRT